MKTKYHGLLTLVAGFVAFGGMIGYALSGAWQLPLERTPGRLSPELLTSIKVPTADQVRQMEALYGRMAQLAQPSARPVAGRPLTLFGYQDIRDNGIDDETPDNLADRGMRLTLTVLAGFQRYCILDGEFVEEGELLPAGERILKIEAHRVLVAHDQERKWIYLEEDPAVSAVTREPIQTQQGKGRS